MVLPRQRPRAPLVACFAGQVGPAARASAHGDAARGAIGGAVTGGGQRDQSAGGQS